MIARRLAPLATALAAVILAVGCAALKPTGVRVYADQGRGGAEAGEPGPGRAVPPFDSSRGGTEPGTDGRDVGSAFPGRSDQVRRVCRSASWARDWIAVEYTSSDECPRGEGRNDVHNTAVIVRHEAYPRGSTLEVCGDQIAPEDWVSEGPGSAQATSRCPGAGKDGAAESVRMRRVRTKGRF